VGVFDGSIFETNVLLLLLQPLCWLHRMKESMQMISRWEIRSQNDEIASMMLCEL